jgi:hypothetical protein
MKTITLRNQLIPAPAHPTALISLLEELLAEVPEHYRPSAKVEYPMKDSILFTYQKPDIPEGCYDVNERLPDDGQYVLARLCRHQICDEDAKAGAVWVVVQFRRGLSLLERGNLPLDDERKTSYRGCDQHGNDQRPYNWTPFGPGSYFGQEVDCWKELPE